ncbi:MAG: S1 RNA-binding domain-containing protein [Oscillospiraceae bacterium]
MQVEVGDILDGVVTGITKFGAFIKLTNGKTGLVHISEISSNYVKDINDIIKYDQEVKVKVLKIDDNNKMSLSMKQSESFNKNRAEAPQDNFDFKRSNNKNLSFEDMMLKFKQSSEEKMCDLKKSVDFKKGSTRRGNR